MSKRPTNIKAAQKLRRLIRVTSPIGYIDLVQWLQDHGHAQTAGEARDLIQVGNVMADSHPLGKHPQPPVDSLAWLLAEERQQFGPHQRGKRPQGRTARCEGPLRQLPSEGGSHIVDQRPSEKSLVLEETRA